MSMTLDEYAEEAHKTAFYPGRGTMLGMFYTALGSAGEAGEYAEMVKKFLREERKPLIYSLIVALQDIPPAELKEYLDDTAGSTVFVNALQKLLYVEPPVDYGIRNGVKIYMSPERRAKALGELGDRLWYLVEDAYEWGFTFQEVAEANIKKLRDRAERGVLNGSGNDR